MFNYKNCINCPHKNIPDRLKMQFSIMVKDFSYFNKCKEQDVPKNILCFCSGVKIDWMVVEESLNKVISDRFKDDKI